MVGSLPKTSVFFILDESYALFPGARNAPRFGGAGLQTYLVADEISQDPDLEVNWVFMRHDLAIESLSHPRITARSVTPPVQRGVPFASRVLNKARRIQPFESPFPKTIVSSIGQLAPTLVGFAHDVGARSVLRISSDSNVLMKAGVDAETDEMIEAYRRVDCIVAQSQFQKEALERLHGIPSYYIPSIWPVRDYGNTKKSSILWVASAKLVKQPWLFLELAKQFSDERFVMVVPAIEPELSALIRRESLRIPNLDLIDRQIPLEETHHFFDEAKIFINTSEYEGFPNTFLQAAASAVPILSYDVDPDGVLSTYRMGASAQGDIMQLIALIERMLYDDELRTLRGSNAYRYCQNVHNPHTIAEAWKRVIRGEAKDR